MTVERGCRGSKWKIRGPKGRRIGGKMNSRKGLVALVTVALVAAGCSKKDEGYKATRTTTGAPMATTTTAPKDTFKVGDTVTLTSGGKFTVKAWEPRTDVGYAPEPGTHYAAAQVEDCRGTDTDTSNKSSSWVDFNLILASHERVTGGLRKKPTLEANVYQPGECVVGWVTFDVPDTATPEAVAFDFTDAVTKEQRSLRWLVG